MVDELKIKIEGDPLPAARPRFNGRRCYQSARNVSYRREVEMSARLAMLGQAPMTGALSATVKLYRRYKPTSRAYGDVDNHLKALFDGMNQIVFADDAQIVSCLVEKWQDKERPRAEVTIKVLPEN